MLNHRRQQVIDLARRAVEDLALTVLHVLLYVLCHGLCNAEILHVLGDGNAHLLGKQEEIVDGKTRSEDNGSVLQNGYLLCAEFFRRQWLHLNKGTEHNLHIMALCDVIVRRICRGGLGL